MIAGLEYLVASDKGYYISRQMTDQNGNDRSKGEDRSSCQGREHVHGTCMREDSARGSWPSDQLSLQWGAWKSGVFCLSIISFGLVKFVEFVVN